MSKISAIPHDQAEQDALEAAERCLDVHFKAELAKCVTVDEPSDDRKHAILWVPEVLFDTGVIYLSNEHVDSMLQDGERVAVAIFQMGPRQTIKSESGTLEVQGRVERWTLRVALVFNPPEWNAEYRTTRKSGRLETIREYTHRLARVYQGVLKTVLLKHLQGQAGISVVNTKINAADPGIDKKDTFGRAWADLEIQQHVTIPTPLHDM